MKNILCALLSIGLAFAVTGCSSSKDRDDWQQYRAKKGQDELSADVARQKAESEKKDSGKK